MTKETLVALLDMAQAGLVNTFNSVPDDKLDWKPLDNGRTALELFSEAAQFSVFEQMLVKNKGQVDTEFTLPNFFQQNKAERANWTKNDALAAMETNHRAMMAAIAELSNEDLALPVTLTLRNGATRTIDFWLMLTYRAYISRFAQINYIQTLYGDFDIH